MIFLLAFALLLPCFTTAALEPINIKGKQFVTAQGERFIIRGIVYQPLINGSIQDVIHDDNENFWRRDLEYLKLLGVNTVRVYEYDTGKSHAKFMNALESMGIYLLIDLPSHKNAIDRNDPTYSVEYLNFLISKMEEKRKYPNVLGVFIGNEVSNKPGKTTQSAAFVKAALRDLKEYMHRTMSNSARYVWLGYAAVDDSTLRQSEAEFYTCFATSPNESVDFYGINSYSWCGNSSLIESGYSDRLEEFADFPVPLLLSEYGCNTVRPRLFTEVPAIFSLPMLKTFSGGIMYEYSVEGNEYGLIQIKQSQERTPNKEFCYFLSQMKSVQSLTNQITSINGKDSSAESSRTCPGATDSWQVYGEKLPPKASQTDCNCIRNSQKCRLKLSVSGDDLSDALSTVCGWIPDRCAKLISPGNSQIGEYPVLSTCDMETKFITLLSGITGGNCEYGSLTETNHKQQDISHCDVHISNSAYSELHVWSLNTISILIICQIINVISQ